MAHTKTNSKGKVDEARVAIRTIGTWGIAWESNFIWANPVNSSFINSSGTVKCIPEEKVDMSEGQFLWNDLQVVTICDSDPGHIQTDQRNQTYDAPAPLRRSSIPFAAQLLALLNIIISQGRSLRFTPTSSTDCKITLHVIWAGAAWCQGCMEGSSIYPCSSIPINHLDKTWRSCILH